MCIRERSSAFVQFLKQQEIALSQSQKKHMHFTENKIIQLKTSGSEGIIQDAKVVLALQIVKQCKRCSV